MFAETKKAVALAALIAVAGVSAVELTRSAASADPAVVTGGAAGYAGARVEAAFAAVAAMPEVEAVRLPVADKGDLLPIGCAGPFRADFTAECIDSAYEVASDDAVVVETHRGASSSILMRMYEFTVAQF